MRQPKRRFKTYLLLTLLVIGISITGGWLLNVSMSKPSTQQASPEARKKLVDRYFKQGLQQMLDRQYPLAAETWQRLLVINESMPEVHANLGFSLIEMQQYLQAQSHFARAMELNAFQANAYYGLAMCLEEQGDLEGALGSMRSFIHLAKQDDPFLRKARSALWEWETTLDKLRESSQENLPQSQQATESG